MSEQLPAGQQPVEQVTPATRPFLQPVEPEAAPVPPEGGEPAPWILWVGVGIALLVAMFYLGQYFGGFDGRAHVLDQPPAVRSDSTATVATADGAAVYNKLCIACHQATGLGLAGAFPPLAGSEWATGSKARVIRILLNGLGGPVEVEGATYNGAMPAWKAQLSHDEIAAVLTHVRSTWGNSADAVTAAEVAAVDQQVGSRVEPWTAAELMKLGADSTAAPTADSTRRGR